MDNCQMITLDHLVLAANTLEEGAAYVEEVLGVAPVPGGQHPLMGTHNCLLNLGHRTYLEVTAKDPLAPPPQRPRWFALDALDLSRPRLLTWVARTDQMDRIPAELGPVIEASRGTLAWHIAVPEDGRLHGEGLVPYVIQWGSAHPTDTLPAGCELLGLKGFHPAPLGVQKQLEALGLSQSMALAQGEVGLEATIKTPLGIKTLR